MMPPGERPPRFVPRDADGRRAGQCMWELVVDPTPGPTHRVLFCTKRTGHEGDHEYMIGARA